MGKMQSALGADNYEKYRNFIRQKESGKAEGDYSAVNQFNFIGAYQMGAPAAEDAGLLRRGASKLGNRAFDDPNNWNNPPGSKQAFLANKELQDKAFDSYTERNYRTLLSNGVVNANTPPDQVAGFSAASHLLGATAISNGRINETDANGTRGASYYRDAARAINGASAGVPPDVPGRSKPVDGAKKPEPRKIYNGSDRKLGPSRISNSVTIGSNNQEYQTIPVPFPNPLSEFSSFNAVITLSSIDQFSHSKPVETYKAGNIGEVILRSAGAGTRAQSTAMVTPDNTSGQYDFFIDNLDIESIITYDIKTKGTNATDITFDVVEPYSMGIFLQACEVAARKNGWPNGYLQGVFLLTVEFVGYDDTGNSAIIPNTTRHIPFTIKDIAMTVKAGGSNYRVKGQPSNEIALDNNYNLFDADLSVSGKTVQEVLQSGEFSLQTVINKRLQEFAEKEQLPTLFDEIVIIFPKLNEPAESKEDNKSATNQTTIRTTTVSRNSTAANLIQEDDSLNEIGRSIMDFDSTTSGETNVNKQDDVQIDPKNPINRSKVVLDSKQRQFIYSQGTSIINAISSILLHSKYCKEAIQSRKVDEKGMVNWFRIETQVEFQEPKEGNIGNNTHPKLLIFKVVPYKAHSEKASPTSVPPKGYDRLRKEAAKVYDYIYTGKNTEVINFDLEFKQAFFNTVAADQNKQNREIFLSGQRSATTDSNDAIKTADNRAVAKEEGVGNQTAGRNLSIETNSGGTVADDIRTRIAKQFQKALNDSATDLVHGTLTIFGDPYFLADSGMGNFSNTGSGRFNVTETGAMDYQSGEVDIIVNFRTPLDYGANGIMNFGDSKIVEHFSGLFKVNFVTHRFQRGKFTQELKLQRRMKQTAVPVSDNPAAAPYASGSEEIRDETGQLSRFRRNTETGELYDATGLYDENGRAIADPKSTTATSTTKTVSTKSASDQMTDADNKSVFNGYP